MNSLIEKLRVNGVGMSAELAEQIIAGSLKLSSSAVTAFDFTILDRPGLNLTKESGRLFREGTTILWEDYALALSAFETGGGTSAPTIDVSATSDFVNSLKKETGGKDWGSTQVSGWAIGVIQAKGAKSLVQPDLGERAIKREDPPEDHRDAQNTWDVLAEMAKQTGAWLFEYGNTIVLARPSWLVKQYGVRRYKIVWNTWQDHTDGLAEAPQYSWNKDAKDYDGKEQLTVKAIDPGPGSINPLSMARPGDIIDFSGAASPTDNALWIVRSVTHSLVTGVPVTLTAWRPIDPPEIIPKSDSEEGEGGSSAGVPNGPIGAGNWQGEQLRNATEIVKEGQRRNLPTLALEIAVMVAMGESSLRNTPLGDNAINPDGTMNDSMGLFQQQERFDTGGHSQSDRMSPAKSAGIFYTALGKLDYKGLYNNGGPSVVHGGYYGPGKSATSASLVGHNIQRNQNPNHYAHLWADAKLIVKACLDAGEDSGSGGGGKASGPLGSRIDSLMKSYEMRSIDVDGAFGAQCYDLAQKYVTDLKGVGMIRANGKDFWRHPSLTGSFTPVAAGSPPRKGDVVSWAGSWGAYPNGGYGHVAIYSHSFKGTDFFLSQNPGPSRTQPLSRHGVLGWMRPKA